jgi:5-methylcytosine-specific restriction endonuclease McrA
MPRSCNRCGTVYPDHLESVAFRLVGNRVRDASRTHRLGVCRPCEQTRRDRIKKVNRWAVKARDTIRRHAMRLGKTRVELVTRYGWDPDRLAHDAEFQYSNGCNYCGSQYRDMGHGLTDISLDIVDPRSEPYYRTNTKWCCQTCNRKKSDRGPDWFEGDRQVWELHNLALSLSPDQRGMLF